MAQSTSQINIWQGSSTKVELQIFDENQIPRDLTADLIAGIDFVIATKEGRQTIVESPTDGSGSVVDGLAGKIQFTISETALDGILPVDVGVNINKDYEPTPTLYGYITLKNSSLAVVDKVYLPDVAIYFNPLPKV